MKTDILSEDLFSRLSQENPRYLVQLIENDLQDKPDLLTFALEHLGYSKNPELWLPILLKYLDHPKPYVREGVIYGIAPHIKKFKNVKIKLEQQYLNEDSKVIKQIIKEVLQYE